MIGVFDSGFGGLSYLKEVEKVLPQYRYCYLGDQLRVPYGGRSREAIFSFTEECVHFLWKHGVKLIIIACNTASSEALRSLQQKYPEKKILGILIPAVEDALENKGNIGVIATRATVSVLAYTREIQARDPKRKVFEVASPLSVPFIEEGLGKSPEHRKLLKKYLRKLKDASVRSLILGCTHYPLIENVYRHIMGTQVHIINSAQSGALKLQTYLERHPEIEKLLEKSSVREFFTTDSKELFEEKGKIFYGKPFQAEKIKV